MIVRPQGIAFFAVFFILRRKARVSFGFAFAGVKKEKEGQKMKKGIR